MVEAICATIITAIILIFLLALAIPYIIVGTIAMVVIYAVDKVNDLWR